MKFVKRLIIILLVVVSMICIKNFTQAKYILTKELEEPVSVSNDFYFEAEANTDKIVFTRTSDKNDHENILTTETQVTLKVKNNDGKNYNVFPTNYTVEVVDGTKFSIENTKYTGTIEGGSLKDEIISFKLKIDHLDNPSKKVKFRITSTSPQEISKEIELPVQQDGAIQSLDDLINLSLAVRDHESEQYGWTSADTRSERWKLTRDLDFESDDSYDDPHRTDFGDVNLNNVANDLKTELTSNTGFLPIGMHVDQNGKEHEYWFMGTFNGGSHSISNLCIEKSLQMNIGLFGWTNGADIRNLTIKNGKITNHNQTAGMIAGRAEGGTFENITVDGASVISLDENETKRDTYSGGIVGYLEEGARVINCVNRASITTKFTGDTSSYSGAAGGITAWMATSTISDCSNYGEITGQKYVGGICGFAAMKDDTNENGSGTVSKCHNYGNVKTYVTNTSSTGPGTNIGGICGYLKTNGIVDDCTNHENASVSGINDIGGIVGYNTGTIKNCANQSRSIEATYKGSSTVHKGGIYGRNNGGTSTNNTDVLGQN